MTEPDSNLSSLGFNQVDKNNLKTMKAKGFKKCLYKILLLKPCEYNLPTEELSVIIYNNYKMISDKLENILGMNCRAELAHRMMLQAKETLTNVKSRKSYDMLENASLQNKHVCYKAEKLIKWLYYRIYPDKVPEDNELPVGDFYCGCFGGTGSCGPQGVFCNSNTKSPLEDIIKGQTINKIEDDVESDRFSEKVSCDYKQKQEGQRLKREFEAKESQQNKVLIEEEGDGRKGFERGNLSFSSSSSSTPCWSSSLEIDEKFEKVDTSAIEDDNQTKVSINGKQNDCFQIVKHVSSEAICGDDDEPSAKSEKKKEVDVELAPQLKSFPNSKNEGKSKFSNSVNKEPDNTSSYNGANDGYNSLETSTDYGIATSSKKQDVSMMCLTSNQNKEIKMKQEEELRATSSGGTIKESPICVIEINDDDDDDDDDDEEEKKKKKKNDNDDAKSQVARSTLDYHHKQLIQNYKKSANSKQKYGSGGNLPTLTSGSPESLSLPSTSAALYGENTAYSHTGPTPNALEYLMLRRKPALGPSSSSSSSNPISLITRSKNESSGTWSSKSLHIARYKSGSKGKGNRGSKGAAGKTSSELTSSDDEERSFLHRKSIDDVDLSTWINERKITQILDHQTRSTGSRIVFRVMWQGDVPSKWIKRHEVMEQKNRGALVDYLTKIQLVSPKRLPALLKKIPAIEEFPPKREQ